MNLTTTPPVEPAPAATSGHLAGEGEAKRQRFTLTRARDLHARLDAITMRAAGALTELEAVGIVATAEHEEKSPIRRQLHEVAVALSNVVEAAQPARGKTEQIVDLLEAL